MEVKELKFLLKLIGRENYQGKISELKPNSKTKVSETEKICRTLCDRELVTCSETITKIKIHSAGKALLKVDTDNLAISDDELKILKACASVAITPGKTKVTPANKREELINQLVERGLITATATKIERVLLTDRGKKTLLEEYKPQGTNSVLSLDLLHNYLRFLRKNLCSGSFQSPITVNKEFNNNGKQPQLNTNGQNSSNGKKPADEKILRTIIDLDKELGTNNYLPIFHLRHKLQPPLSRKELDEALYRLQRQDKLELSSLVEAVHYTKEQIEAGIPQDVGGSLFFLMVN
jgi:predicted transcriptional regulator